MSFSLQTIRKSVSVCLRDIPVLHPIVKGLLTNNQSAISTMDKANAKLIYSFLLQFGDVSEFLIPENLPIGKF